MSFRKLIVPLILLFLLPDVARCQTASPMEAPAVSDVEAVEVGQIKNVHRVGDLFLSGQFQPEDIAQLKALGIKTVISLRTDGELDWDEAQKLDDAGIKYENFPFRSVDSLTTDLIDSVRDRLKNRNAPMLLHCASANRVGAVWLTYRVLDENIDLDTATTEAMEVGLSKPDLAERAREYIESAKQKDVMPAKEQSAKPGINENFLSSELNVKDFVDRFEMESREIYAARERIIAGCNVKPGQQIADVGAGTGLFTRLFSDETGEQGWVYAIDISTRFLEHINSDLDRLGIDNVTTVLCPQDDIGLPPNSVDLIFVCDTYHHFEFPQTTLASMNRALKKGGHLVVIDFERIPGKSREWLLGHVRADKTTFRSEIESAGFTFAEELKIPQFQENYFLKFTKE
ncbi:MAG: methyltransferase domain-containing protein [Pirellulaceae bacterium]